VLVKQNNLDEESAKSLEGLAHEDLMSLVKQAKGGNDKRRFQFRNIEVPGRGVMIGIADTSTGQIKPTDYFAGYKLSTDTTTGTRTSGANAEAPATDIIHGSGKPLRDLRTEVGAERAGANKASTELAKTGHDALEAEARAIELTAVAPTWMAEYRKAQDLGTAGPVAGRWTKAKSTFGVSSEGPANQLDATIANWGNKYIHDTTGAQMSMEEFRERFNPVLPSIKDDEKFFSDKLAAFLKELDRQASELKAVGNLPGSEGYKGPQTKEVIRMHKGKKAVFDATTKKFLRYKK